MEDHEPKYIQFYFTLSPLMKSLLPSMTIKFDEQHNCRNALSFILNLDRFRYLLGNSYRSTNYLDSLEGW